MAKPSLPQGTKRFPDRKWYVKDNTFFNTIRTVLLRFIWFVAPETPAMENLDTLMGKYGEEGDKLIFKILNSGR